MKTLDKTTVLDKMNKLLESKGMEYTTEYQGFRTGKNENTLLSFVNIHTEDDSFYTFPFYSGPLVDNPEPTTDVFFNCILSDVLYMDELYEETVEGYTYGEVLDLFEALDKERNFLNIEFSAEELDEMEEWFQDY